MAPVTQIVKVELAKSNVVPSDAPADDFEYPLTTLTKRALKKSNFSIHWRRKRMSVKRCPPNHNSTGVQGERTLETRVYSSNGQEVDRQELSSFGAVTQIVKSEL